MSSEMPDIEFEEFQAGSNEQYLTFVLNNEYYGLSIRSVKEVIEYDKVTPVPMMSEFVKGVLNLRGEVVPVIDLNLRFGKGETEIRHRSCIAILEIPYEDTTAVIGVVVDSVKEVIDIMPDQIDTPPSFGAQIKAQFIQGVANIGKHFVIILDGEKVLSVEEMADIIEQSTK
ncbi:chemotaxis protein CheW [Litoribrevibacter euphylliae]|uniref:Chemotaxis protein CheW n=1 Tax=Litoribrevibacter euphylliae TaxID=1834034 RepID=A0ABV7H833_9GAMM